ncbi:hypothetical protein HMI55_004707 [Coelomomyces lativittatus]|nr:hypothetical protein HMI55_004707 [Coelomomyces lativittatus]
MKGTKKNNSNVPPSNTNEILASSILNSPTWCSSPSDTSLVAPNPKYQDKNYDEQEDKSHHSFFSILRMVSSIAFREATRQKGHYFLGFGMIFLVVYIISLLITIGSYSPLVFMEMGEGSQGEIDFVLTPSSSNEAGALNYTRIEGLLPNAFHSPRPNNVIVQMYPASSCSSFDADDPFNPTYPYTYSSSCQRTEHCLAYLCNRLSMSASLYLVDSNKERKATIGRTWTYPTLPPNHVVIDQTFAYSLGVAKNDYLFMVFPLKSSSLKYFYNEALNEVRASNPSFSMPSYVSTYVVVPVIVHDVVTSSMGKFAATERNFIVMEYATILNVLAKHLHVDVPYSFRYSLDQTSKFVYHQVDSVLFSKSVPRFSTYLIRDFPTLARNLLDWGNELQRTVGPTDSQSTFPVLNELYDLNQVSMFIDLFIQLLILFLGSLSVFLIYSLLMTSIETKIFHFGIVRMVGMTRLVLISMLVIQALFYSIPASVVGLICSELSFIFLKGFLEDYLRFTFDPFLTLSAVLVSFSLALLVPLLSSIAPIRLALSHHLHEALSRNRLTISSTTMITIIDPKKDNQKIFYLCVGVILSAFGFSVYYFLPKALVNNDLVLLLNIFLFILISLIFGLVVLADNFIKVVQSIVFGFIFTLLFMENHAVRVLVRSNLLIHRVRNRKTALIYSLGLAFIIFISVTTKVQLDTLQYNYRRIVGADIIAYSDSYYSDGTPASVSNSKQLTSFLSSHDWVVDVEE